MSNEPKHTATPWEIKGNVLFQKGTTKTIATVHIQNNFDSVRGKLVKDTESEANAARIVQCVEACEGMDDPEKEIKIMRELESKFKEDLKRANERGDSNRKMMVEQSEMNVAMKRELESLRAVNAELIEALKGMVYIVQDSSGVYGYHKNGDLADWDEFNEVDIAQTTLAKYENHDRTEPIR